MSPASPIYHANVTILPGSPRTSFLKMQPKLLAIPQSKLQRINLDLTMMAGTVHAAADRILTLRDQIVRELPSFELEHVDELADAALALDYAHGGAQAINHPSDGLEELHLEASQTRARAIQDLRNLATHGLIDPGRLREFAGKPGYKAVIDDVRLCVHVYNREWPNIEGKTCTTHEDVERASQVIRRMTLLIGLRAVGRDHVDEWIGWRDRAFTLLFNHYGEARRAVQYLRYPHGDADSFAPSLFKCRMKRRKPDKEEVAPTPPPSEPARPVFGPNGPFVGEEVARFG